MRSVLLGGERDLNVFCICIYLSPATHIHSTTTSKLHETAAQLKNMEVCFCSSPPTICPFLIPSHALPPSLPPS